MGELFLLGRVIFGGFFIYSGVNHFLATDFMTQYVASKGMPLPEIAVLLTGALLVVGGLSIVLGMLPQMGLTCLALFLIGVTPIMHDFWNVADPAQRMNEMGNFFKNVSLLGACLMMYAIPQPWARSVDRRARVLIRT